MDMNFSSVYGLKWVSLFYRRNLMGFLHKGKRKGRLISKTVGLTTSRLKRSTTTNNSLVCFKGLLYKGKKRIGNLLDSDRFCDGSGERKTACRCLQSTPLALRERGPGEGTDGRWSNDTLAQLLKNIDHTGKTLETH
jgi:hypothetical protein